MSEVVSPSIEAPTLQEQEQTEEKITVGRILTGIIIRPRQTFKRLQDAPKSYWWAVFLITVLAIAVLAFASVNIQAQRLSNFTPPEGVELPEDMEMPESSQSSTGLQVGMAVASSSVQALLGYVLCAFVVFSMSFIMGGKVTFKQAFRVSVWSSVPLIVRRLVQGITVLISGNSPVAGLAAVMTIQEASSLPAIYSLLSNIDVYLIWNLVLLGIGTSVVARLNKSKSAVVVIVYVIVTALILLGGVAVSNFLNELTGGSFNLRVGGMGGPPRR